ncbi:hypothetical protein BSKO_02687 [Bryopsis sp. KO-2023]|nr:hypothetical protein BSKO_02687 [Bryopsis sp. KO-2023]
MNTTSESEERPTKKLKAYPKDREMVSGLDQPPRSVEDAIELYEHGVKGIVSLRDLQTNRKYNKISDTQGRKRFFEHLKIPLLWQRLTETMSSDRAKEVIVTVLEKGIIINQKGLSITTVAHVHRKATTQTLEKMYKECCDTARVVIDLTNRDMSDDDIPIQEFVEVEVRGRHIVKNLLMIYYN